MNNKKEKVPINDGSFPCSSLLLTKIHNNNGIFSNKQIKQVELIGRLIETTPEPFTLKLLFEDYTSQFSAIAYQIKEKQYYYGISSTSLEPHQYYKITGILRPSRLTPIVTITHLEKLSSRTDINHFLSLTLLNLIHHSFLPN